MSAFDADELTSVFKKARESGAEVAFAFGAVGKSVDCALMVDRKKGPKVVLTALRAEAKPKKVSFGWLIVDGREVRFKPEKIFKGMIKQLRVRFREEKITAFKPVLVGPDGEEIDEDALPDEGADEEAPADPDPSIMGRLAEAWDNQETATKGRLAALARAIAAHDEDPDAKAAARVVALFVQNWPKGLADELRGAATGGGISAAEAARQQVVTHLENYRPLVEICEQNVFGIDIDFTRQTAALLSGIKRAIDG